MAHRIMTCPLQKQPICLFLLGDRYQNRKCMHEFISCWTGFSWSQWEMEEIFTGQKCDVTVLNHKSIQSSVDISPTKPVDICLFDRPVNEKRPGGRASGPSAGAIGQHAVGRGCGGAWKRWRGCCRCVCCHQLWRDVTWQLARALRLQKQVEPDSQYLPHWAGEVWAGTVSQQETSADIARTRLPVLKLLARSVIHWHVRSRVQSQNISLPGIHFCPYVADQNTPGISFISLYEKGHFKIY